jgi:hypothetical protein
VVRRTRLCGKIAHAFLSNLLSNVRERFVAWKFRLMTFRESDQRFSKTEFRAQPASCKRRFAGRSNARACQRRQVSARLHLVSVEASFVSLIAKRFTGKNFESHLRDTKSNVGIVPGPGDVSTKRLIAKNYAFGHVAVMLMPHIMRRVGGKLETVSCMTNTPTSFDPGLRPILRVA